MRTLVVLTATIALCGSAHAKSLWMLNAGGEPDVNAALFYGVEDSPEEVDVMFRCHGGGTVEVSLPRTSEELTSGTDISFTMAIGPVKSTFHGGTSDNQLDGIPSATAMAGIRNPVIQALAGKGDLVIQAGKAKYTAPLASMGKKARRFLEKCKSNM